MHVDVTFRHVRATKAIRTYAEDKVRKLAEKYRLRPPDPPHVILEVAKNRHNAEITMGAKGEQLVAHEQNCDDLYAAIDLALDKLDRQLRKRHAIRVNHKGGKSKKAAPPPESMLRLQVFSSDTFDEEGLPQLIRTRQVPAKPMSVDEAVMQMDISDNEFLVFRNDRDEQLSVIYRRKDGNYGLIESD